MSIVGVAIDDACHGHDGLELWGSHGSDLQRVDTTPGNTAHAHRSVRPALPGEPSDNLHAVGQLGNIVLIHHDAFGVPSAADIDSHESDVIGGEVLAGLVVAPTQVVP
jgi:hypothetical protein